MSTRHRRQKRILELVVDHTIRNQDELRDLLASDGIDVTQATLSRDLRALNIAKGSHGYVMPGTETDATQDQDQLGPSLRRQLLEAMAGSATVVMKTEPGHASGLALEIDQTRLPEVLGTIAGDDTIFIATRSENAARKLLARVLTLAGL